MSLIIARAHELSHLNPQLSSSTPDPNARTAVDPSVAYHKPQASSVYCYTYLSDITTRPKPSPDPRDP